MDEKQPAQVIVHSSPTPPAAAPSAADHPAPPASASPGNKIATVKDTLGRVLTVSKLGPLEKMRLFKIAGAALSPNTPLMGYAAFAAAVRSIDGSIEPFPTSMMQVEAMVERLGEEGLEAVLTAYIGNGWVKADEGDPAAIKNS